VLVLVPGLGVGARFQVVRIENEAQVSIRTNPLPPSPASRRRLVYVARCPGLGVWGGLYRK